jgi:membrane-associated phospholipid phosphatase
MSFKHKEHLTGGHTILPERPVSKDRSIRVSESLVLFNIIAYGLLRLSADIGGFNWWGLYRVFITFLNAVLWLLPMAYFVYFIRMYRGNPVSLSFRKIVPLRELLVVLLLFISYWSLAGISGNDKIDLIHYVTKEDKSWTLVRLDDMLLGYQPSQRLETMVNAGLTTLMLLIYTLAYIPLLLFLLFTLHIMGESAEKELYVTGIMVAYTIALPFFFLIPAPTPEYVLNFSAEHPLYTDDLGRALDKVTKDFDSTQRNSFPSLHVALSTLAIIYSRRLDKIQRVLIIALVVTMWFSTLYLRQHYFIDLIGGWTLALLSAWASPKLINDRPKR